VCTFYLNFIISKTKNVLPQKALKTLYYALVHPHLLYCLPIYSCTSGRNINKLFKMQKKAIRNISNAKFNEHTLPLFTKLRILPLNELILYTRSLLMHSFIHKYGPATFHEEWQTNASRNQNVELRNRDDLYVPTATSDQVSKLPIIAFAKLWNNLHAEKMYQNPALFKNLLIEHIWNTL
jgi:hypothetical protein